MSLIRDNEAIKKEMHIYGKKILLKCHSEDKWAQNDIFAYNHN